MTINNFICPCCGLPNHLEFQSKEDYDKVREQEATGVVGNINTIFNKYLVGDEEGRNPSNEVKLELKARLEKIQQISSRFNEQSFQDWFDKNVVCFINEKNTIILTEIVLHTALINVLTAINLHTEIQTILTENINHIITQNILTEIIEHITTNVTPEDKLVHIQCTYTISTEAIEVEVQNNRTGTKEIVTNYYPSITLHKEVI